jgi:hypothetical protein
MAADLELVVLGPDDRPLDEFTAFRWAFLEIHGFGPGDDPGGDAGWLKALVEKILGCPVEENEWGAVALLAWIDNIRAAHKALKDECREALEIHDYIDAVDPGLPMAKRVAAAASRMPDTRVSAGPDRSLILTRSAGFVDVITFIDTSGNGVSPVPIRASRPREYSPRRQRVRSSSSASRDGPDDSEPHLGSPARAGRLGVEAAA